MKKRGWIMHRVEKLADDSTTAEVRDTLKIADITLRQWSADPYCQKAKVVTWDESGRLHWHKDKLRLWIIAVSKIGQRKRRTVESNPPLPTKDQARKLLGMPKDHTVF